MATMDIDREVDVTFNTGELELGRQFSFSEDEIRLEVPMLAEPLEIAYAKGGEITKRVLDAIPFMLDRKNIAVEVKVQYVAEGNTPAHPNAWFWHVDAPVNVPVATSKALGYPRLMDIYSRLFTRQPRFWFFQTDSGCPTQFLDARRISMTLPQFMPTFDLVDRAVKDRGLPMIDGPEDRIFGMDCWELHRASKSVRSAWRYWMRVAEIDETLTKQEYAFNAVYTK